jgi:anti-anti-sigma regulatory factor
MNGTMDRETLMVIAVAEPGEHVELVRGTEQSLLARLTPLVTRESVSLDMAAVERIDAAGLSALITLYCDACKSGHIFTVARPRRHVREILSLVGLDRILMSGETGMHLEQSAA